MAWAINRPGVTAANFGARKKKQVDGWVCAAGVTLRAHEFDEVLPRAAKIGASLRSSSPSPAEGVG